MLSNEQISELVSDFGLAPLTEPPANAITMSAASDAAGLERSYWYRVVAKWERRGLPFPSWGEGQALRVCRARLKFWLAATKLVDATERVMEARQAQARAQGAGIDIPENLTPHDWNQFQQARYNSLLVGVAEGALIPVSRTREEVGILTASVNEALEQAQAEGEREAGSDASKLALVRGCFKNFRLTVQRLFDEKFDAYRTERWADSKPH